ncbi:MAG: ubiquinol-cytochrome C chaperone [Variibacter sp.]|nr:ubiquinol-cytochrome C chaperone [Variibacter sp.]
MLSLFRRKRAQDSIVSLYGAIVAQARRPPFYAELGVPDTVEGRFDMIVLHLALVIRRLRAGAPDAQAAAQALFDHFCRDMDHNLREMGVSDLAVPRKMRRIGEAFYGRAAAYDRALDAADDGALAAALARNVFAGAADAAAGPARLAAYVRLCGEMLAGQEEAAIAAGSVRFPAPAEAGALAPPNPSQGGPS